MNFNNIPKYITSIFKYIISESFSHTFTLRTQIMQITIFNLFFKELFSIMYRDIHHQNQVFPNTKIGI